MRYWIETYDGEDLKRVVEFETDEVFKTHFRICDSLITYMEPEANIIEIPEGVTTLCDEVFWNGDLDLPDVLAKQLVLPDSLTEIGNNAFLMTSFQTISISPLNKTFIVKDGALLSADRKRLIYFLATDSDEEFYVPESTESIDGSVLYINGKLHIPSSVTNIGEAEFYDCVHIVAPEGSYAIEFAKQKNVEYEIKAND